jgi:predicted transcriptional regulator
MDMLKRKITSQANFTNADILIALKIIEQEENIGRKLLSNRIFLNEASIRSILTKLKDSDYISSSRLGHKLTTKGKHFLDKSLQFEVPQKINAKELTLNDQNYGSIFKNASSKIKDGMDQRDSAVFGGARSAITLIFRDNHFTLPETKPEIKIPTIKLNLSKELEIELHNKFAPKNNDIVIISSAEDDERAFRGLVHVIDSFI